MKSDYGHEATDELIAENVSGFRGELNGNNEQRYNHQG